MIDAELVTRKMVLITRDLTALDPIARKDITDYLASGVDEVVAERYLERIIGRMIDINYHLITETGHAPPTDYFQSFTQLAELRVLDRAFAARIAACAGLRNRLVHEYNELDPRKVHEALQTAVGDIPVYLQRVNEYLSRAGS
ncbi:MAG TPA: HepT-like ribonuclease domain-containing protein [Methylomirabilota bacterium]|nr:HepT-like ribonuclease domain-containing protein [Methylomirabilota bacterium]